MECNPRQRYWSVTAIMQQLAMLSKSVFVCEQKKRLKHKRDIRKSLLVFLTLWKWKMFVHGQQIPLKQFHFLAVKVFQSSLSQR